MALIGKEDQMPTIRAAKTAFFLISMLISFLVVSAPVLFVIADVLIPTAILSSTHPPHVSNPYDFTTSLFDIPLLSFARSAIIILVYSLCDGPRLSGGHYLGIITVCSISSIIYVSVKASYFFNSVTTNSFSTEILSPSISATSYTKALEVALFICSAALAMGHTFVAYRISCRERRKLLVYKIDIEAVVSKNGFPVSYSKLLRLERMKWSGDSSPMCIGVFT